MMHKINRRITGLWFKPSDNPRRESCEVLCVRIHAVDTDGNMARVSLEPPPPNRMFDHFLIVPWDQISEVA
jgi:hypothetical protein